MTGKFFAMLILTQLTSAQPAWAASESAAAQAGAESLFEQGLAEMQAGRYELACPHLAESYRLDPLPGALFTLAECEASWNKLASALTHYQSFLSALSSMPATRRDTFEERRGLAAGQVTVLVVSAPQLTVNVSPELPPGLVVKADGVLIPPAAYGVARRVDPGSYVLRAELAGEPVWERRVELRAGNQATLEVQLPKTPAAPVATSARAVSHSKKRPVPAVAFVAGGVALAGFTTGVVAGLLAYGKMDTIDSHCPERTCDAQGRAALNSARADARISTVGFSFGVAGLAAAALVLLLPAGEASASDAGQSLPAKRSWRIAGDAHGLAFESEF